MHAELACFLHISGVGAEVIHDWSWAMMSQVPSDFSGRTSSNMHSSMSCPQGIQQSS